VTGWIKGDNIVREPDRNTGANLCLEGTWDHAPDYLDGTFDWRQASFSFTAPASGKVTIGCRLGYWSNTTRGKVWFDDIEIVDPTVLRLDQPQIADASMCFRLIANPGRDCRIEVSTDLKHWNELKSLNVTHPVVEIIDTFTTPDAVRFYRAVEPSAD
jgi:hypothetical protein